MNLYSILKLTPSELEKILNLQKKSYKKIFEEFRENTRSPKALIQEINKIKAAQETTQDFFDFNKNLDLLFNHIALESPDKFIEKLVSLKPEKNIKLIDIIRIQIVVFNSDIDTKEEEQLFLALKNNIKKLRNLSRYDKSLLELIHNLELYTLFEKRLKSNKKETKLELPKEIKEEFQDTTLRSLLSTYWKHKEEYLNLKESLKQLLKEKSYKELTDEILSAHAAFFFSYPPEPRIFNDFIDFSFNNPKKKLVQFILDKVDEFVEYPDSKLLLYTLTAFHLFKEIEIEGKDSSNLKRFFKKAKKKCREAIEDYLNSSYTASEVATSVYHILRSFDKELADKLLKDEYVFKVVSNVYPDIKKKAKNMFYSLLAPKFANRHANSNEIMKYLADNDLEIEDLDEILNELLEISLDARADLRNLDVFLDRPKIDLTRLFEVALSLELPDNALFLYNSYEINEDNIVEWFPMLFALYDLESIIDNEKYSFVEKLKTLIEYGDTKKAKEALDKCVDQFLFRYDKNNPLDSKENLQTLNKIFHELSRKLAVSKIKKKLNSVQRNTKKKTY